MSAPHNPPAFPNVNFDYGPLQDGMTLRDWFAGQALANPTICTGAAPEYQLKVWFGGRCGITRPEIVAWQAREYADAMLAARKETDPNG